MQVNLIHSTLVFREKNIIYMTVRVNLIHSKLVFFKCTKIKHTKKKIHAALFACTVQMNCIVYVHAEIQKIVRSYFTKITCKI